MGGYSTTHKFGEKMQTAATWEGKRKREKIAHSADIRDEKLRGRKTKISDDNPTDTPTIICARNATQMETQAAIKNGGRTPPKKDCGIPTKKCGAARRKVRSNLRKKNEQPHTKKRGAKMRPFFFAANPP